MLIMIHPSVSDVLTWDGSTWKPWQSVLPGGEANTGSNVGTGRDILKQKVGINLEFNTIRTIDTTIDVDANTSNNTIDIKISQVQMLIIKIQKN